MRSIAAILVFVQVHITDPSSQEISRCSSVSVAPHLTQDVVVVRWIAAKRSLVGIISCTAVYHADFIWSENPVVCTFVHTRCHAIPVYLRTILSSLVPMLVVAIVSSTPLRRFLNFFMVSCGPGGGTYAMSKACWRIEGIPVGRPCTFGGFAMGPVRFHFLSSVVVREPFFVHKNYSRACRSVLHLASMFTRAQPPCSLGSCNVVTGTRKIAPCQMNQVHTVVSCCTCSLVGGRICATYQIFARRHRCTYCILCARQRVRA